MSAKPFDIVVHGATGFTGQLVVRALLADPDSAVGAPNALKWAMAGRNEKKLLETKQALKKFPEVDAAAIDAVPIIIADSFDEVKIVEMVKQTKVVLSMVGPYKLYGEALVKACAENGVHYCDITGETYWIREMIEKYEPVAQKTGARIVNCCGMDSIPSDMTAFMLAETIRQKRKLATSSVKFFLTEFKAGVGGGTLASGLVLMDKSTPAERSAMANPFYLTDEATVADKQKQGLVDANAACIATNVTKESEIQRYSSQFFMTICNQAIVHRSNYLLGNPYGDKFVYRERLASGGWFYNAMVTLGVIFGFMLLKFKPTRKLVSHLVPKPGQGPTEAMMQSGFIEFRAFAYDTNNELGAKIRVSGVGDAGFLLTSKMIAECAKCLAKNEASDRGNKGGVLTPASAFGRFLWDRLERKHIFKFELEAL